MATLADIAVVRPDILDIFDFDTIGRDVAHNNSLPPRWTFPDEVVDATRAQRAAEEQAAQEAALAQSAAATAKDLGQAPPELLDQAL
jgi:HD-like signal output (HDOD) protein